MLLQPLRPFELLAEVCRLRVRSSKFEKVPVVLPTQRVVVRLQEVAQTLQDAAGAGRVWAIVVSLPELEKE